MQISGGRQAALADEVAAQRIARGIPSHPLTTEQRSQIAETLRGEPLAVRRRARELVKERWDRESETKQKK
jgi:hypothetical protein